LVRARGETTIGRRFVHGLVAGAVAGVVSGTPSTLFVFATDGDPLASTAAAGTLLLPHETRLARLVPAGVIAHAAISLGWGVVLSMALPRRHTAVAGAAAGALIATLDLRVIGRSVPAIAALDPAPQVADHLAYGAVAGAILKRLRTAVD
jgi:hypothetical protein